MLVSGTSFLARTPVSEALRRKFRLIETLAHARTKAKLSQAELAKRIGTTQSATARLEGGGVSRSLSTLRRHAEATGARLESRDRHIDPQPDAMCAFPRRRACRNLPIHARIAQNNHSRIGHSMIEPSDEILTLDEVAAYLKAGRRTVYRLAANGQIPAFKLGGTWRFQRAELNRWIAARIGMREAKPGPDGVKR